MFPLRTRSQTQVPAASLPGFEEIRQAEIARIFGRIVLVRLWVFPVFGVLVLGVAYWETALWRRVLLSAALVAVVWASVAEVVRFRRHGLLPRAVAYNLGLAVLTLPVLCFSTGALESPLVPLFPVLALLANLLVDSRLVRWVFTGTFLASAWVFAAVEVGGWVPQLNLSFFGGGVRAGHNDLHLWTSAAFLSLAVLVATSMGRLLRGGFDAMIARALEAREESLRGYADQAKELTALSGEIAHELKNPLASIKGLAALVAKDAAPGKPAERLGVLRHEADRMQSILDEFLNFSRPLVPLNLEQAELGELCRQVAALHEGIARERGVELAVRSGQAVALCDPRKVKQVLVNLVQNAIDASAPGSRVELGASPGPGGARVEVVDRGRGLDPAVAERIFEPGVTTKTRGSGLGLTIARALARQHGGELTLANRPEGGCLAQLHLPAAARVEPSAQATLPETPAGPEEASR